MKKQKTKKKLVNKPKPDAVNHPAHYNSGRIEVIEALEDWNLPFHEANAVKYIARAGKKNPDTFVQDLQKAIWYLNRKIEVVKFEAKGLPVPKPDNTPIKKA